jgi:hypothetical protein
MFIDTIIRLIPFPYSLAVEALMVLLFLWFVWIASWAFKTFGFISTHKQAWSASRKLAEGEDEGR